MNMTSKSPALGFSLLELTVALAISALVITVATSVIVSINRNIAAARSRAVVHEEAKLLAEYLGDIARNLGGDTLRPWNALVVENNCEARNGLPACDGSDRVTFVDFDPGVGSCSLVAKKGNKLVAEELDTDGDGIGDACCLSLIDVSHWEDRTAQVRNRDGKWENVKLKKKTPISEEKCAIEFSAKKEVLAELVGANLAATRESTFFVDPVTHELKEFVDLNDNDFLDEGEARVLTDRVYDFQVALAYDVNADGRLEDTNSNADEWLYNSPEEEMPDSWDAAALRMISIGVIVGAPSQTAATGTPIQLLDGPTRTENGVLFNSSLSRLYFRNGFVIQ